jgi:Spy/CpxP family protein refolding chaperone
MTKTILLLAAATAALAASPANARPITAADMHIMHRHPRHDVTPHGL